MLTVVKIEEKHSFLTIICDVKTIFQLTTISTNPKLDIVYFLTVKVELVMATKLEENCVTELKNKLTKPPTSSKIA